MDGHARRTGTLTGEADHGFPADPPYYAVIFTSLRSAGDDDAYAEMAGRMEALAATMPGYLGVESAREQIGITISYWSDLESIAAWKRNTDHLLAQAFGRERWYDAYSVRIAKVERAYGFSRPEPLDP